MYKQAKQTKQVWFVDGVAILVIGAVALLSTLPNVESVMLRYRVVMLMAFYFIGKSARDFELKLWEKRHRASAVRREAAP